MVKATASAKADAGKVLAMPLCASCEVTQRCFGQCTGAAALRALDQIVERRFTLKRGDYLFRIGEPFRSLFVVRSGCLKSCMRNEFGRQQVVGFYLPGDIVGMGGVGPRVYIFNMRALKRTAICEIPFDRLEQLAARMPEVRHNLAHILGQYLARGFGVRALMQKTELDAKIAGFLLDFSERLVARGFEGSRFELPMTRSDIANHLGISRAAVNRGITHVCEKHRLATIDGNTIRMTNVAGLRSLAARNF
jgi:CRP/FNR family transcriptional regulator, anaerobic regulatory protein